MKHRKHYLLDRRQIFYVGLAVLCAGVSVGGFSTAAETADGRGFAILLGAVFLIAFLYAVAGVLFMPCFYVLDKSGLCAYYVLGFFREKTPWETIPSVATIPGSMLLFGAELLYVTNMIPWFFDSFSFLEQTKGQKRRFFMRGEMVRTVRGRYLLERYTGIPVEDGIFVGLLRETARDLRVRMGRPPKLERRILRLRTRFAREAVEELLEELTETAAQRDLRMQADFYYREVNGTHRRFQRFPHMLCTYHVDVTISRQSNPSGEPVTVLSAPLVHIRPASSHYVMLYERKRADELEKQLRALLRDGSSSTS